ncbi:MAG: cyclic nucleotide-binding domain-containing protein [Polyangiaceae bacterium]|nr:cyclic nucleotide-binding domain-containing protein [Polyangiaceae bacterium]
MNGLPQPLDTDDDDVAWALQTAQVQWKRGSLVDAIVWLRRAVEAAVALGQIERAAELNGAVTHLTSQLGPQDGVPPPPGVPRNEVDSLLDGVPVRQSVDIEFDDVTSVAGGNPFLESAPPSANPFLAASSAAADPFAAPSGVRAAVDSVTTADDLLEATETSLSPLTDDVDDAPSNSSPGAYFAEPALAEPPLPPFDHEDSPTLATSADELALEAAAEAGAPLPRFDLDESESEASPDARESEPETDQEPEPEPETDLEPEPEPETELEPEPELGPEPGPPEAEPAAPGGAINLEEVPGLEDLPPEAQAAFAARARVESLDVDEEIGHFAVALVLDGWVSIMAAVADASAAVANPGDVVFTLGSLSENIALRVVSGESDTRVAVWDDAALAEATADCPWVADELRAVADRFQALAGVTMGPLGERLDDSLREEVTKRCTVRAIEPGQEFVQAGAAVPGMHIVGSGLVEIVDAEGNVEVELGPGDFLFASEVLGGGKAHASARAGPAGALLLFADRMVAHELLVSVPPLLEILAS